MVNGDPVRLHRTHLAVKGPEVLVLGGVAEVHDGLQTGWAQLDDLARATW
jgi:hypothetical protein